MADLKKQTLKGFKWNAIGQFSNVTITFLTGIVLARLLSPEDFGTVGMIAIFFTIAKTFVDSGFGIALIRKKNITDYDTSTVFYFNFFVSTILYLVLFFSAPQIASFFHRPILTEVVRVSGLSLFLSALNCVQFSLLTRNVDFKTPAIISLISYISSGILGILLAYKGYGVWALVYQSLLNSLISAISVWFISEWRPRWMFSWNSFHELFGFGGKILGSRLLDRFAGNLTSLAIGRFYSPADLGYYTRGSHTANIPSSFLYSIVGSVSMPVLSKLQDDDELLIHAYRKYIKTCSLVIFFLMFLLVSIAKPVTVFLYSEKWLPSVIYLQLFCLSYMFYHIHAINVNLLIAKGRSDLNLRIEFIKKIIFFTGLAISLPISVMAMCITGIITSQLSLIVNTYYTGKLFNFGYWRQWKDFLPYIFYSVFACIPSYLLSFAKIPNLLNILMCSIISTLVYLTILYITGDSAFSDLIRTIPLKKYIKSNYHGS